MDGGVRVSCHREIEHAGRVRTLIVKTTRLCTSNCAYCDVVSRKKPGPSSMSDDVAKNLLQRVAEYLRAKPDDAITWIWHGGEPLLLPKAFYRKVLESIREQYADVSDRLHFDMQSNLMVMDREWAELLQDMGLTSIGSSYDPEPGIRGPGESRRSDIYNKAFLRGMRIAEDAGLSVGIIYVVTKKSLANPLELFRHLTNLRPDGALKFNPVLLPENRFPELRITPEEYADFLGAVFAEWWPNRQRYSKIDPFQTLVQCIIEKDTNGLVCVDSGICAHTHASISLDGRIAQCGRSDDWDVMSYGNIRECSLLDAFESPLRLEMKERYGSLRAGECSDCRFWDICHGGCPLDSLQSRGHFKARSPWSAAQRRFIEEYFEPITGICFQSVTS
ncbi:MAG: radical SAM protein [Kiritimatiellae bacterium]|nr:radical SAM protein [Kiritimatiellia bacterium]